MATRKIRLGTQGVIMPPIENLIKNARRNEDEGYDSLWWPDHLMGLVPNAVWTPDVTELARYQPSPHVYLDIVAAMTAVGLSTERVRLGVSVSDSIRRHPAMLAQSFLTLDHITKGRAILGLGSGEKENITPYGLDFSKPVSRLEESLQIIRLLWSTDQPVDFDGSFCKLKSAVLGLRPYGQKPPPIWLGAMGPRMLEICGKYADGWIPTRTGVEAYGQKLARIKSVGQQNGRDMSDFTASLSLFLVIDKSHEECHRLLEQPIMRAFTLMGETEEYERHGHKHPLGERFSGLQDFVPTELGRQETLELMAKVPSEVVHDHFYHGTPEELCALLEQYAEQGLQHAVLHNMTFMADVTKLKSSFEGQVEILRYFQ